MNSGSRFYNSNISQKLGFDAIVESTLREALTPYGKQLVESASPRKGSEQVAQELAFVSEWIKILESGEPHPLFEVEDISETLEKSRIGDYILSLSDFLAVRENARLGRMVKQFLSKSELELNELKKIGKRLISQKPLEELISGVVTDRGELRDDASSELKRIRKRINREKTNLRNTIQRVMKRVSGKGMASDEGPTIRSGRMVIPIQAEFKRKVDGFIHDVSSTGQTIYLEPVEALQINNEIRQLESEEQREIERILRELTRKVNAYSDGLDVNIRHLAKLDAIHSRASLGLKLQGSIPELSKDGSLNLIRAMNPILLLKNLSASEPEPVVPLDLSLDPDELALIITGPNAGGKSVAMKTVGLINLMMQTGYPVPAQPDSIVPVISNLFVDVGDDQSIENDLSTFSSRLQWMRETLKNLKQGALVLIDEAGSGTDPEEGGALFQAFIESVVEKGARTIITTHHGSLKVFAHEYEKVVNGAMEFNQKNLTPTYRFKKGYPGSSYAFEIADRLHLPDSVMGRARELLGEKRDAMGELLIDLEKQRQESESIVREYNRKLKSVKKREKEVQREQESIKKKRKKILQKSYQDAEEILKSANQRIEQAVEKVVSEGREDREKIREARRDVGQTKKEVTTKKQKLEQEESPTRKEEKPQVGDFVLIGEGNTRGELVELSGKNATVLMNGMKVKAKINKLVKTDPPKKEKKLKTRSYSVSEDTDLNVSPSIDLRGLRAEEAIKNLTKYIDNAVARGLNQVEIIHGKGEGILHKQVHDYLSERKEVVSFEIAPWESGGSGATVVQLI